MVERFFSGIARLPNAVSLNEDASACVADGRAVLSGLGQGTMIFTQDGALPVEYLVPGERIVTRSGLAVLRAVSSCITDSPLIRVQAGVLGHGRPERDMVLGPEARILLQDWRAQAFFGQPRLMIEVSLLKDGRYISDTRGRHRVFALHFDPPAAGRSVILYADGVEVEAATGTHPN